jgi:hypothetical protein
MPFNSFESVDQWVADHSRAELEENVAGKRFAGARLMWAERWLEREREKDRAAEANRRETQAVAVDAQQIEIAERTAAATESQASTAVRALTLAKWALGVSILAIVIALIEVVIKR